MTYDARFDISYHVFVTCDIKHKFIVDDYVAFENAMTQVMMYKARGPECGQALLQESWVVYAKRLAGPRVTLGDTRRHARNKRCLKVNMPERAKFELFTICWTLQCAA